MTIKIRVLSISLSLFVLLAMTAFLFAQIAKFEAYAIDVEDEVIAVEENLDTTELVCKPI